MPESWAPEKGETNAGEKEKKNEIVDRNSFLAKRNEAVEAYNEAQVTKDRKRKKSEIKTDTSYIDPYSKVNEFYYQYQKQYYQEAFTAKNVLEQGEDLNDEQKAILAAVKKEGEDHFQEIFKYGGGTAGLRSWLLDFYPKQVVESMKLIDPSEYTDPNQIIENYEDEYVAMRFNHYKERFEHEQKKRKSKLSYKVGNVLRKIGLMKENKNEDVN